RERRSRSVRAAALPRRTPPSPRGRRRGPTRRLDRLRAAAAHRSSSSGRASRGPVAAGSLGCFPGASPKRGLRGLVEDVKLLQIEAHAQRRAWAGLRVRRSARGECLSLRRQLKLQLVAKELNDFHLCLNGQVAVLLRVAQIVDVLRPDTEDDVASCCLGGLSLYRRAE